MASATSVFRHAEAGPKVVAGNGQFAWDLYKKLAGEGDNVFYSPISISLALAMTYIGARNDTREQMRKVQGFSAVEDAHLHSCFEDLHTHLHNTGMHIKQNGNVYVYSTSQYPCDFTLTTIYSPDIGTLFYSFIFNVENSVFALSAAAIANHYSYRFLRSTRYPSLFGGQRQYGVKLTSCCICTLTTHH